MQQSNKYNKGLDRDTSISEYGSTNYYEAVNMRLFDKNGLSGGSMSLINGTTLLNSFSTIGQILETTEFTDYIIVYLYTYSGGKIYKMSKDDYTITLIYENSDLAFTKDSKIRSVGIEETDAIHKIYFTDGENFFYFLNVINDSYPIDKELNELEIVSDVTFENIDLSIESGGNLQSGRICYAYQLYNVNGSQTDYSPTSKLISLTEYNEDASDSFDYFGSEKGVDTNKSVKVSLTFDDDTFGRVRLVAIHYEEYNTAPTIRIVGEYDIEDTDSIDILDNGDSIGSLTLAEFRAISNDFIPTDIIQKDKRLYAAGIDYNYSKLPDDFDTRAFRFNSSSECKVKNTSGYVSIDSDLSTLPDYDTDCFNPYNDLDNDNNTDYAYKYKADGSTLGGTGKYISYTFITTQILIDEQQKTYDYKGGYPRLMTGVSNPLENYTNPLTDIGYQRDEIYRFAFVAYDLKGRALYAKWIGDIRFPNNEEKPFITYSSNKTYANILGIQFTVDLTSDDTVQEVYDMISGYEIVRVKRDNNNSTIITSGVGENPMINTSHSNIRYTTTCIPSVYDMYSNEIINTRKSEAITDRSDELTVLASDLELDPDILLLNSPDVAFNKTVSNLNDGYVEYTGYVSDKLTGYIMQDGYSQFVSEKFMGFTGYDLETVANSRQEIKNYNIYKPIARGNTTNTATLDNTYYLVEKADGTSTVAYNHQCCSGDHEFGLRGTCLYITPEDEITISESLSDDTVDTACYYAVRVNRAESIYGGITYEDRTNNEYISCSDTVSKDITAISVYGGDTYISMFCYLRGIFDDVSRDTSNQSYLVFPVESKINIDLRLDPLQNYMQWGRLGQSISDGDYYIPNYALMESETNGVTTYGSVYPTAVGNLYRYNTVYSTQNESMVYYPEPFDYVDEENITKRITVSEKKTNGEYSDSYLQFKFNNILDVDDYGDIVALIENNSQIICFQTHGIGKLSINERITTISGASTVLGTGGILERIDYLSTNSGVSTANSIVSSENTLYYVDSNLKRIYSFRGNANEPISLIKGLDSYLQSLDYDTIDCGFDPQYYEVLFNIDGTIICYHEYISAFTAFYSYNPDSFIQLKDKLLVVKGDTSFDENDVLVNNDDYLVLDDSSETKITIGGKIGKPYIYELNTGTPGVFYSELQDDPYLDFSITLLIKPEGLADYVFDSIKYKSLSKDTSGDTQYYDCFDSIIAQNSHTSFTKDLEYSEDYTGTENIVKYLNDWGIYLVTDSDDEDDFVRMIDQYIAIKLKKKSNGNSFKLYPIITNFRIGG